MAESKQRERSSNFTKKEIELLIQIVDEQKHIIECKKSDATTWRQKDAAWEKVADMFNFNNDEGFRSKKALKSKYEDMKKTIKKKLAHNKAESLKNDGDESQIQNLTAIEQNIVSMVSLPTEGTPFFWSDNDEQSDTCQETQWVFPHEENRPDREQQMKEELHEMRLKILKVELEIKQNQLAAELKIRAEQSKAAKIETEIKELEKQTRGKELRAFLQD